MNSTGDISMDYTGLAQRIAKLQAKKLSEEQNATIARVPKAEFWKTLVCDAETAYEYYNTYHPEYPEILCRALADRITQIKERVALDPTSPELVQYLQNQPVEGRWDYKAELEANGVKV